jgi:phosphoglycerol transferase MdoB-like AlkP superfamily enzyme
LTSQFSAFSFFFLLSSFGILIPTTLLVFGGSNHYLWLMRCALTFLFCFPPILSALSFGSFWMGEDPVLIAYLLMAIHKIPVVNEA